MDRIELANVKERITVNKVKNKRTRVAADHVGCLGHYYDFDSK